MNKAEGKALKLATTAGIPRMDVRYQARRNPDSSFYTSSSFTYYTPHRLKWEYEGIYLPPGEKPGGLPIEIIEGETNPDFVGEK